MSRKTVPDYSERGIRLIGVLPAINQTNEIQAGRVLRERIIEELYFKGYPKIPGTTIDAKLSKLYKEGAKIPPSVVGEMLGVDAVLYCTISEWKTSFFLTYGVISVSVSFELRSSKTGEILWSTVKSVSRRSLDISKKEVELKTLQDYEAITRELVDAAMVNFPEGPNFIANAPQRKSWIKDWF